MSNFTITLPEVLTGKKISDLFGEASHFLDVIHNYKRITFDSSKCNFINPAGIVLMSAFRDLYKEKKPSIEYDRYKTIIDYWTWVMYSFF